MYLQLPEDVTFFPNKVAKKKPRDVVLSVLVLSIVEESNEKHEASAKNSPSDPHFLFLKRPEKGLLANQWEFPNVVLKESIKPDGEESLGDVEFSEEEKWKPFEDFIREELGLTWGNSSRNSRGMPSMYPVPNGRNEYIKNAIVHIFSHQKHIMHVIVKEVHIDWGYQDAFPPTKAIKSNREAKIMSQSEIEKSGITTGMKKVLNAARMVLDNDIESVSGSSSAVRGNKGRSANNSSSSGKTKRENGSNNSKKHNKSKGVGNNGNILKYLTK